MNSLVKINNHNLQIKEFNVLVNMAGHNMMF